jgi:conjugal transfer pilus assembly protein TraE
MDLNLHHRQAQQILKQRNALAIGVLVLIVLLVATFSVASTREREVVLMPIGRQSFALSSKGVPRDYLEMVTRDTALLALNRSPEGLQYWMNSLLEIADPQSRGALKVALLKIYQEQAGSQISQFFSPDWMEVHPETLSSEIGGTVHTMAANKEVSVQHRTFRFAWSYNGISLKLRSFGAVVKAGPAS